MKKRYSIPFICFILIFSLLSMNIPVLADTVASTSVSLSKSSDVLTIGQTDTLTATVLPSDATNQNITWISSNPAVAKVFNGLVMALGEGTAYITAFNTTESSKYATCLVIVKKPDSVMSLNKTTDVLTVGSTDTLTATISPSQAVTWTSSDTNVVQVFNGVLMAQSVGTAVITATAADGSNSVTCTVTVNNSPASVTLSKTSDTLAVGGVDTLIASVSPSLPSNAYLMWLSSSPGIVSVSGGVITGESLGSAVITAIASDGSCSATCNVTVTASGTNTTRLGGANRYETSAKIAEYGWANGSAYAVLATGNNYPDALSAAPLAKKYNAPILLTDSTLPQVTLDEIKRLNPTQIFICGGTGVVSQDIENQLKNMGISTERLEGNDRYGTSAAIAEKLGVTSGELMVANGYDWSDALSASSIAAKMGIPILLTDKDVSPDAIDSFISQRNFSKTYILGNTDLISNTVGNKLPNSERIVGSNEYERNINIIKRFESKLDLSKICVATGTDFPDALSGSALAATLSSTIVLVDNNNLQAVTTQYAAQFLTQTNNVYVFGLQGAVSDDVISKLFTK
ncbi:cell wall-binding repeat-containing protein [Desulfitobacterium sp.]|uniref:cell wall-binding repeat-containing protein n=1 Tax=Desulfitobacterium sp. TaxID=49981 RepID=UPI002BD0357B|nr:cell wall-binding repeat-containing protein [Desulfitobacterium sp.]HVJ49294.1 cell wall-binding repeat-containing protein [Desulfitobacterium sp.]